MRRAAILALPAMVALALVGQILAAGHASPVSGTETGAVLGEASFAYLSSVRTFAAAILWNRLDPQLHAYYESRPIEDLTYMLPTIYLVLELDPDFTQPYYVAPWILAKNGKTEEGLELAERGVRRLPRSGLLHASYAQMLAVFLKDLPKAEEHADAAVAGMWSDYEEQYIGLGICRAVYRMTGRAEDDRRLEAVQRELDRLIPEHVSGGHDHSDDEGRLPARVP